MEATINDFFNYETDNKEGVDKIFKYINKYISELERHTDESADIKHLEGLLDKLCISGNFYKIDDKLLTDLSRSVKRFLESSIEVSLRRREMYDVLEKKLPRIISFFRSKPQPPLELINDLRHLDARQKDSYINLNGCILKVYNAIQSKYQKQDSIISAILDNQYEAKNRTRKLILESIELIDTYPHLTDKAKQAIIGHLHKALHEIDHPSTNWSVFFGNMKEAIFLISAFAALASAGCDVSQLITAGERANSADTTMSKPISNSSGYIQKQSQTYLLSDGPKKILGSTQRNSIHKSE